MTPDEWLKDFREMHAQVRVGKLPAAQEKRYQEAAEQFARALLAVQSLSVPEGSTARRNFRVAYGLQIDLGFDSGQQRLMTQEISCGGFSVLLKDRPKEGERPGFSLRLPGGVDPFIGRSRVVSVIQRAGNSRVSFAFEDPPEKEIRRLEAVLIDLALARMPVPK
jgi:hypothetical protein